MTNTPLEPTGGLDTTSLETNENAIEMREVEGLSQSQIVRRRFFRHRGAIAGLVVLLLIVVIPYSSIGIFGIKGWWKWDPNTQADLVNAGGTPTLSLPSWLGGNGLAVGPHPLGQEELRQDHVRRHVR